jgi:hypothetical protein
VNIAATYSPAECFTISCEAKCASEPPCRRLSSGCRRLSPGPRTPARSRLRPHERQASMTGRRLSRLSRTKNQSTMAAGAASVETVKAGAPPRGRSVGLLSLRQDRRPPRSSARVRLRWGQRWPRRSASTRAFPRLRSSRSGATNGPTGRGVTGVSRVEAPGEPRDAPCESDAGKRDDGEDQNLNVGHSASCRARGGLQHERQRCRRRTSLRREREPAREPG